MKKTEKKTEKKKTMQTEKKSGRKPAEVFLCSIMMLILAGCAACGQPERESVSGGTGQVQIPQELLEQSEGRSDVNITGLTVEYRENPLGIDAETPVFAWQMRSEERGQSQSAYQIRVSEQPDVLQTEDLVWDSGKVTSDRSVAIPYEGEALKPETRYYWDVAVWDAEEKIAVSTEENWFETGLMGSGWDGARWIGAVSSDGMSREIAGTENSGLGTESTENDGHTRYQIEYDLGGEQNALAGFIFGADTDRYGEFYVWSVGVQGEQVFLKMFRMEDYYTRESETVWLEEWCTPEDYLTGKMQVRIEVDGAETHTFLNDTEVAQWTMPKAKPLGRIGFYNGRTDALAYLDNLRITDGDGREICTEDFEQEQTIFSPEYIGVREGMAQIKAGVTLVPGKDGPAPILRKSFWLSSEEVTVSNVSEQEENEEFDTATTDVGTAREASKTGKTVQNEICSARLYAAALGIYHITLNGTPVTDHYFDAGQMVYNKELNYCTYDVASLLQQGENQLQATLGHGWFDRALGAMDGWSPWGEGDPAFLAKLVIEYSDGSRQVITTDESWEATLDGPVRRDDMYQGEIYEASREDAEWSWSPATVDAVEEKFQNLPFRSGARERVKNTYVLEPVTVTNPKPGTYVYDFGQEFSGNCRIRVQGNAGDCITLRYAEALNTENLVNPDDVPGTVWTRNLLTARNTDYYFLKGGEEETYEPLLVTRAFRYVQISGLDEDTRLLDAEGIVLMSDLTETGSFETSDIWLNRLYHNILWSQRSNFLDVPTDCPQRDERFGWAGDIGVFADTAVYNMQARSFLKDYLRWMRLQQKEDGSLPDMAPHTSNQDFGNSGWGDAFVSIAWALYQQYADLGVVSENFDAMCAWVDYLMTTEENGLRIKDGGYGDHLQYHTTPKELTDTAQAAYSALLVSRMAEKLERPEEVQKYREIYETFRSGWQEEWLEADGMLSAGTQTAYALGLKLELYPEELREAGAEYLRSCVQWFDYHPAVGYVGMPHLLPALETAGGSEDAYRVLLQKTAPSWNYQIAMGATTLSEAWPGYTGYEDGTYSLHGSLNHHAPGSIGEWFYSGILGISSVADNPGFKRILLKPQITDQLQYAGGGYSSMYGRIESRWENTENGYVYRMTIPANTSAEVVLPIRGTGQVTESGLVLEEGNGITVLSQTETEVRLEMLSGRYEFQVAYE